MTYERLNVEALRWHDRRDVFGGEGAQNRGLASVIEAKNEDACLTRLFLQCAELTQ